MSTVIAATAVAEKENAPESLAPHTGKGKKAAASVTGMKGRKRTITLVNGVSIDLQAAFAISPELVDAMKERIFQLEDELEASQKPPPAKRARVSTAAAKDKDDDYAPQATASSSNTGGPSTAQTKADEKKRKLHLKKIFDSLKKECKSESCKFQGLFKSLKVDHVLEATEFESIFGGKGVLIQPTPTNKPKSTVTIIEFRDAIQIQQLFGDELKTLKGNTWTRGGMPARRFGGFFGGGGSTFTKSVKTGTCDVSIQSIEVNYSKNNMKCTLKFQVAQVGGDDYDSDDY